MPCKTNRTLWSLIGFTGSQKLSKLMKGLYNPQTQPKKPPISLRKVNPNKSTLISEIRDRGLTDGPFTRTSGWAVDFGRHLWRWIVGSRLGPCYYSQDWELGSPWSRTLVSVVWIGLLLVPREVARTSSESPSCYLHCIACIVVIVSVVRIPVIVSDGYLFMLYA